MAAVDTMSGQMDGREAPAGNAAAVSKHDTNELAYVTRGIYVGGEGDVAVTMAGGGNVTFVAVPAGTILPVRVTKVLSTGTDATSIVAIW